MANEVATTGTGKQPQAEGTAQTRTRTRAAGCGFFFGFFSPQANFKLRARRRCNLDATGRKPEGMLPCEQAAAAATGL